MRRIFYILPLLFALGAGLTAVAQQDTVQDNQRRPLPPSAYSLRPLEDYGKLMDSVPKWQFHVAMGTSLVGNSYNMASLYGITPTVVYRPNSRLKVVGSVTGINSHSLATEGYTIRGREERSLVPYRYPSTALAATVAAEYQVNDHLWLAAAYSRMGGELASGMILNPWLPSTGRPLALDASSFTAAMRYRFNNDSFLDVHLTVINDRAGTLAPLIYNPYGMYDYNAHSAFGYHLFNY